MTRLVRLHERNAAPRDPILFWAALVGVFALMVVILGLVLGHAVAARRAAMLSFVSSYQPADDAGFSPRPVRVVLAR